MTEITRRELIKQATILGMSLPIVYNSPDIMKMAEAHRRIPYMSTTTSKLLGQPAWSGAGPSPIQLGNSSVTGAIQAIAGVKVGSDPDTYVLFAAAVNGGIWRT